MPRSDGYASENVRFHRSCAAARERKTVNACSQVRRSGAGAIRLGDCQLSLRGGTASIKPGYLRSRSIALTHSNTVSGSPTRRSSWRSRSYSTPTDRCRPKVTESWAWSCSTRMSPSATIVPPRGRPQDRDGGDRRSAARSSATELSATTENNNNAHTPANAGWHLRSRGNVLYCFTESTTAHAPRFSARLSNIHRQDRQPTLGEPSADS